MASDTDLETSISGDDINAVHAELLQRINQVIGVEVVNTRGRGADFFGISHPTVMNLLQSSPGIKKCVNYKMTKFEVIYSEYVAIFLFGSCVLLKIFNSAKLILKNSLACLSTQQ